MDTAKPKSRIVRRRPTAKVAMDDSVSSTPAQVSAVCGHSACDTNCNVHYVGPTSSLADHHVHNAARAGNHVWAAAIVSGLAVVLTGAVAYSSVQAGSTSTAMAPVATQIDMDRMVERLSAIEIQLRDVQTACAAGAQNQLPKAPPSVTPSSKSVKN